MKVLTYKDYNEMCREAADVIVKQIKYKPDSLLCFPSGDSPTGVLNYMMQYAREGKVDFSNCYFVGLDEWVGMDKNDEGSCSNYLHRAFFTPMDIKSDKMMLFNARATDLDSACKEMDNFIAKRGPLDIMMVGVGMNGHIGLNEPGADFDSYSHHSPLDPVTIEVAQKYFKQSTSLHEGITLGLKHLQEAKLPMLIASGLKKAKIIAKALNGEFTNEVPASIFQKLPSAYVFVDLEAASLLT